MFSILQKSQDAVNAEDLEILQKEIEQSLVNVVTQKWELERELLALSTTSPEPTGASQKTTTPATTGGKLKNQAKLAQIEVSENATDGFKGSLYNNSSNNGISGSGSGTNSTEDDASSEGSLVGSVTGSTIITTNLPDYGSQVTNSTSSIAGIKRAHKDDRPSKRFRQNSSTHSSTAANFPKRPPHSKHRAKIVPSKFRNSEESRPYKKQVPKNEAPDKLWPFVEQFCATPTNEQITELEEMMEAMENDKEYFRIPHLGGGKKDQSGKDSPSKLPDNGTKNSKKSKTRVTDEEPTLGALTQRVVSSFIEEGESNSADITSPKNIDSSSSSQSNKKKNSKSKANKNIELNNKCLEKRIRQGLEDYEILDQQDDIPYTSEEDEILRELVASQHELLSIQRQNKDSMQILLKRAKKHMELEIERERLREANTDVVAAYHRLIQAKQRKRNPTKKEKDAAWVALRLQESIYKRCDELYMSSLNRD